MSNIGKKLTVDTPEEESAKQKVNDLCEAIAIMYRLEGMFCKVSIEPIEGFQVIGRETGRDYYSYEELLISQWEKTDKTPLFTKKAFARAKAKEIRGLLDEVERLSEPSYYSNNPVYIMGLGYIDYLNNLDVESKNSNDGVTLTPGIKGRPGEKESANLAIYLSCSKEDKTKIEEILKDYYRLQSWPGVIEVLKRLEKKDYYTSPLAKKTLWDSLRILLKDKCSYSNLNKLYRKNPKEESKQKIDSKLP